MKTIRLLDLSIKNFKGIHSLAVRFNDGKPTIISGQNATGKTSVYDAITYLMFGTDSLGNAKFEIRELDAEGNKVHHTDISIEGTFVIDGAEVVLSKTQREKWTKRRGTAEAEYGGNVNEYSINGYPKTEKEYKAFIADIIDEKIFKILTNPIAFSSLDWKEQRKILFEIIGEIDDSDMEKGVDYYSLLKPELAIASIDDIRQKYMKSKRELAKKPDELQTRIDEVSSQIVDTDRTALETEKADVSGEISALESQLLELDRKNNYEIDGKIAELSHQLNIVSSKANEAHDADILDKKKTLDEADGRSNDAVRKYRDAESNKRSCEAKIVELKSKMETLNKMIEREQANVFPEDEEYCKACGQKLPKSKIDRLKASWTERHEKAIHDLNANRMKGEAMIANAQKDLNGSIKALNDADALRVAVKAEYDAAMVAYKIACNTPKVDPTTLPEYIEIKKQMDDLASQRIDVSALDNEKNALREQILAEKSVLTGIQSQLNAVDENAVRRTRIKDLEQELKETSQKIADCEKMLYACECYVRAISKKINDHFDGLEFKLFENQINGGLKETCQITIDGVPYSSLNSGHKIIAGLNIIKVLRDYYQVNTPVIIDNSESLSNNNFPKMPGQMILLKVSDEPNLTIS